jgi:hypothetical protein
MVGLKEAIFDYISNSDKYLDSVDIVTHFKLRADITLKELTRLEEENRIKRIHRHGVKYVYKVI